MELDFREWVMQEGWLSGWKGKLIPLFAAGVLGIQPAVIGGIKHIGHKPPPPIKVAPEEIGIKIPDSPTKGFAFSIKNYGHVSENDITIKSIRSGKGGMANLGLKGMLQSVDLKKHIANELNAQSQYGYSSLPPGTVVDDSRKQQIPNKVVTITLDDWPIFAGTPFDPIYITATLRLDLTKGEAWIAPAKTNEHLALL
jgi:hypothetical protein